ncbi:MAG: Panacea domain-containing protein [bacterium]
MLTAKDIADYFLSKCDEEAGDTISNLKIQKLVYYAQGFYLALYGKPLFNEKIEAWMHGPVVPVLYDEFKNYGSSSITIPEDVNFDKYPEDVKEILDDIYNVYGQFSAWKLRELTHNESPWKNTPEGKGSVISHEELKKYFSTQINDEENN